MHYLINDKILYNEAKHLSIVIEKLDCVCYQPQYIGYTHCSFSDKLSVL